MVRRTDPAKLWWNRPRVRLTAAWICWVLSFSACAVVGWVFASAIDPLQVGPPNWVIPVCFVGAILLFIAAAFLCITRDDAFRGDIDEFNPRVIITPLAGMFLVMGGAEITHAQVDGRSILGVPLAFAICGALAIVVIELILFVMRRTRNVRARVRRRGVTTEGTVTRARGYTLNYHRVTRVAVRFTDHLGRHRWVSETVAGQVPVGAKLKVRYSPGDLERKGGAFLLDGM